MLSSGEVKIEKEKLEVGDESAVKEFVASKGGKITNAGAYIEVSFPKDTNLSDKLCGQTFRASTWHNLRASMLKEGRFLYEE